MPDLAMFAAVENSPDGLLGKLACVSKAWYKACKEEANRRAKAAGRNIPPGGVPLPPVIARLLTTPGEVEWALQPGSKCLTSYPEHLTASIAAGGSIPALEMVSKKGMFKPDSLFRSASRNGHQDVLKWAIERGCPWHFLTCSEAAWGGHLDLLKWAIQNGAPHESSKVSGTAARRGHFEVVKWYSETYGWEWDDTTCFEAAGIGRLDILKWAREHGAPWGVMTCSRAALGGHLEVLQWARDNGAPWNEWTCSSAARHGHLEVLKWAIANGAPRGNLMLMWGVATCNGRKEVMEWMESALGFRLPTIKIVD
jgi:hypothetical protein